MARLTQLSDKNASTEVSDIFAAIRAKIGMVPNLYRVAASKPSVLRALLGANDALSKGGFDARTREAIALAVAGATECDYCASAHAAISVGLKVNEATIRDHLAGQSTDPRLNAILGLAGAVVASRGRVADADLDAARAARLSDADVVETVGNVVVNIFTNYLNLVAATDIDFPARRASAA